MTNVCDGSSLGSRPRSRRVRINNQELLDNLLGTFIPMKQWEKSFERLGDLWDNLRLNMGQRPKVPAGTYVSLSDGGPVAYSLLSTPNGGATFIRYEFCEKTGMFEEVHKYHLGA